MLLATLVLSGCQTQEQIDRQRASETERIDVRIRWAKELIQDGHYEEAKRPLTQALNIDSTRPALLSLMAFVFQQQGEDDVAEDYYQRMLDEGPDYTAGINNYGIFLLLQGRYDEACPMLERAASNLLYEGRPQALENLGSCYKQLGQVARAKAVYEQVLRLVPDSPIALIELADIAYDSGDTATAWSLFNRFSELVSQRKAEHSARSLWLGIRLSRASNDVGMAAAYALLLKNMYPNSMEYQLYKDSR